MALHFLLAVPFFAAGIVALLPDLFADSTRELLLGLLTTAVLVGEVARQLHCQLDPQAADPAAAPQETHP